TAIEETAASIWCGGGVFPPPPRRRVASRQRNDGYGGTGTSRGPPLYIDVPVPPCLSARRTVSPAAIRPPPRTAISAPTSAPSSQYEDWGQLRRTTMDRKTETMP